MGMWATQQKKQSTTKDDGRGGTEQDSQQDETEGRTNGNLPTG
jgi:hypothetical protein